MRKTHTIFLLFLIASLFTAYKKTGPTSNKRELLINKNWMLTSQKGKIGTEEIDIYSTKQSCEKDNLFCFEPTGIYVIDEAATKCKSTTIQLEKGVWYLSADQKVLTIIIDRDTTRYNEVEVTATTLKLSATETSPRGTAKLIETYSRK